MPAQGVDAIFRLNAQRDQDFRRGKRLGRHDRLMIWFKPAQKPVGVTDEEWARVPAQITVREVKIKIHDPQCRVKEIVLVKKLSSFACVHRTRLWCEETVDKFVEVIRRGNTRKFF